MFSDFMELGTSAALDISVSSRAALPSATGLNRHRAHSRQRRADLDVSARAVGASFAPGFWTMFLGWRCGKNSDSDERDYDVTIAVVPAISRPDVRNQVMRRTR